jgi:hypothetical protein
MSPDSPWSHIVLRTLYSTLHQQQQLPINILYNQYRSEEVQAPCAKSMIPSLRRPIKKAVEQTRAHPHSGLISNLVTSILVPGTGIIWMGFCGILVWVGMST